MRGLHGVFPVLKPAGVTSSQLLEMIKANLGSREKMGHGGTLDKSAKGVLVVGINTGCMKLPVFLGGEKVYRFTCLFGRATDTHNVEGKTTMEKPFDHITLANVVAALEPFKGKILQKPPNYSALKLNGKRFSDLMKEGIDVEPDPRWVQCNKLQVLEFNPPSLSLELVCGRGFYVRSLVHDLGLGLDSCAHVTSLERTRQGPFTLQHCLTGEQWTWEGIRLGIEEHRQILEKYIDVEMAKFRERKGDADLRRKKKMDPLSTHAPTEQWTMRE